MADNPFAQPSTLPFELPPFDRIHDERFPAGLRGGHGRAAAARSPPSRTTRSRPRFENTIVALERSGQLLQRVRQRLRPAQRLQHRMPQMQKIDTEMAPKLAAHATRSMLDAALWARVDALYAQARQPAAWIRSQLQLLTRYHTQFVRAGAQL